MYPHSIGLLGAWLCIQFIASVRARYNHPLSSARQWITKSFRRPLRAGLRSSEYSSFEERTDSQSLSSEGSREMKYDRGRRSSPISVDIMDFLPIPAPAPELSTSTSTSDYISYAVSTKRRGTQRGSTADFISRAIDMHGDQYDYSLTEFGRRGDDKVTILCTRHDPPLQFSQTPYSHLAGFGCRECAIAKTSQKLRGNTADFVSRAVEIHGDQYDYSLAEYGKTAKEKVAITCTRHDPPLVFEQSPQDHLAGHGCRECAIVVRGQKRRRSTAADFVSRAVEIHGDQYDYSLTKYDKIADDKVTIICTRHDPPLAFEQSRSHHLRGHGCRECGLAKLIQKLRGNTSDFISRAVDMHGDQYDYSLTEYGNTANDKVTIICTRHDPPLAFEQSPQVHLSRRGCPTCPPNNHVGRQPKGNTEDFIAEAVLIHGDRYDYSLTDFGKTNIGKVTITCARHDPPLAFEMNPWKHLAGFGCQKCGAAITGQKLRGNTSDFISRAVEIHGDQYDYSLTEYGNTANDKVTIICTRHDPPLAFEQRPSGHLAGFGCRKCASATVSQSVRRNKEDFIARAVEIHGDQYDYSLSVYGQSAEDKVTIICTRHDPPLQFEQSPHYHLRGMGCSDCDQERLNLTMIRRIDDFIAKAVKKHGNKFKYHLVRFVKSDEKVTIICTRHNEPVAFKQCPRRHLSSKGGCPVCVAIVNSRPKRRGNTPRFIARSRRIHGDKFSYALTKYWRSDQKVTIICKRHDPPLLFFQTPNSHLSGRGCYECGRTIQRKRFKSRQGDFKYRAVQIHGDKYDYSLAEYGKGKDDKVTIVCTRHDPPLAFEMSPIKHLSGGGCPECYTVKKESNAGIEWLEHTAVQSNPPITIKHALNGGQHVISCMDIQVDGYCEETNTVYEFHESYLHGDPAVHNRGRILHSGVTAGKLFDDVIDRDNSIKSLGYNLVVMWESEWSALKSADPPVEDEQ